MATANAGQLAAPLAPIAYTNGAYAYSSQLIQAPLAAAPLAYSTAYSSPLAYSAPLLAARAAPLALSAQIATPYQIAPLLKATPVVQAAPIAYSPAVAEPLLKAGPIFQQQILPPAPIVKSAPVVAAAPVVARIEEADAYPSYQYSYNVQDSLTGDSKTQEETRKFGFYQ